MGANATNAEIVTLDVVETFKVAGTAVNATAAELNMAADNSANTEVVTTTNVITAAESGTTFVLNSATAFVSTLPAAAAGLRYRFIAGATQVTGGNHTVVCTNNDNTMFGSVTVAGVVIAGTVEGNDFCVCCISAHDGYSYRLKGFCKTVRSLRRWGMQRQV